MNMRFDNIRLLVIHYEDCFAFYRDVLGLRLTWGEPNGNFASFAFPDGGSLGLFRRGLMAQALGTSARPHDALAQDRAALVIEVKKVDESARGLAARGAELLGEPRDMADWGIRVLHLRDPDGNLLELFEHLEKSRWSEGLRTEDARSRR
jgi:catechol 2,3-dioxygenase-like lactoylglutathione lyase family enzyme